MSIAISIENVSKIYRLGTIGGGTLAADLNRWWARVRGKPDPLLKVGEADFGNRQGEKIWALRDVSFQVPQGQAIGIIGRNGAGKSTLLKILSRVTAPTRGEIKTRGRIASLLEVGTGFHPELTGRENIFLNGMIMGMRRFEIKRKLDEIIAFSEIETYIDTPVKRYSSGMYVRLAFAVAAHLEPEILVVDEVLAVGDAAFQKKCLSKMEDAGDEGRTVLFVSHNMQAIRQLCHRAVLFSSGALSMDGSASEAIESYLHDNIQLTEIGDLDRVIASLPEDPAFKLESILLLQHEKRVANEMIENGAPLEIEIHYKVLQRTTGLRVYFDICDDQDLLILRSFHDEDSDGIPTIEPGDYTSKAAIPANFLGPIQYKLYIRAGIFNVRSIYPNNTICIQLHIINSGDYNKSYLSDTFRGKIAMKINWTTGAQE